MPDFDEELDALLAAEAPPRPDKGPAQRPDLQVGMELEDAARQRDERGQRIRARDEAAEGGLLQAILDATGLGGRGSMDRVGERGRQLWDDLTLGDARVGGRNPIDPIVGSDERGSAPAAGFLSTATLGLNDEAAGAASALTGGDYTETRDDVRARSRRAAEQAPSSHGLGQALGTAPLLAVPGAPSSAPLLARLAMAAGQGAQLGATAAFGNSEHDIIGENADLAGLAGDTAIGGALGGALGFAGQAGGDALGAIARGPSRAPADVARRASARDDALLAATGTGSGDSVSVRAFDFGDTLDQIARSRQRAAQILRDTRAVPAMGNMRETAQSIDRARGGATSVMDDVRTAMGSRGPTGTEIADRLGDRAQQIDSPTGAETRSVIEDFIERYGGRLDEETGARVPLEGMRAPSEPIDFERLMEDLGNLRDRGAWRTRAGGDVSLGQQGQRMIDRELRGSYDDAIEAQLAGATSEGGGFRSALDPDQLAAAERLGPDPVGRYRRARQEYAVLDDALSNARRGEERLAGNRLLGFSEQVGGMSAGATAGGSVGAALAGPVGAGIGAPLGAVAGAAGQRAWRGVEPRVRATAAQTMDDIARLYPHDAAARIPTRATDAIGRRASRVVPLAEAQQPSDARAQPMPQAAPQEPAQEQERTAFDDEIDALLEEIPE